MFNGHKTDKSKHLPHWLIENEGGDHASLFPDMYNPLHNIVEIKFPEKCITKIFFSF